MQCETAVKETLPAVRALLAEELHGKLTQDKIAEALETTQPAISRYLKQARGKKAQEMNKNPKIRKMIKLAAEHIINGDKMQFCPMCKEIRNVKKCGE